MTIRALGPDVATVEVLTFREGVFAAMAHDLVLRATAFDISVDPDAPAVVAVVDARATGIVLRARSFPEIRFASSEVVRGEDGIEVRGALSLAGVSRPVVLAVRREGERLETTVRLHQPEFGIAPYRAMLGALRVKPDVVVRASLPADGL